MSKTIVFIIIYHTASVILCTLNFKSISDLRKDGISVYMCVAAFIIMYLIMPVLYLYDFIKEKVERIISLTQIRVIFQMAFTKKWLSLDNEQITRVKSHVDYCRNITDDKLKDFPLWSLKWRLKIAKRILSINNVSYE